MTKDVAVITVNWNGWRHTLDCLSSLRSSRNANWRLYIVDNNSSDDSIDHLQNLGDDVVLIRSPENGGWTGGNNLGLRQAMADGLNYFFLLNNDALVEPDTIQNFLSVAQTRTSKPVLGAVHRQIDGPSFDFIGAEVDYSTGMPMYKSGNAEIMAAMPAVYESSFVSGAALFMCRPHIETVGFFDEAFYLNYDETDWCFRARDKGIDILMVKNAVIKHAVSASIGGMQSPLNVYFMIRNSLLFAEKHASAKQRFRHAVDMFATARRLTYRTGKFQRVAAIFTGRNRQIHAFHAGVRDYLLRRFGDCPAEIRTL